MRDNVEAVFFLLNLSLLDTLASAKRLSIGKGAGIKTRR
jgi:hypothetical protein